VKLQDVPAEAWTAQSTPVPTKVLYDWHTLYETMQAQGFVVIETDQFRTTTAGGVEAVLVKAFNSFIRQTMGLRLKTKRISATRWYCTL